MGERGEYCKICGGAHPTGACTESSVVTKEFYTRHKIDTSETNIRDYIVKDVKEIFGYFGYEGEGQESGIFLFKESPKYSYFFDTPERFKYEVMITQNLDIIISLGGFEETVDLEKLSKEGQKRAIREIKRICEILKGAGILISPIFKIGENMYIERPKEPEPKKPEPPSLPPEEKYLERPWYFTLEKGSKLYDKATGKTLVYLGYQEHYYYLFDPKTKEIIKFFEEDFSKAKDRFKVSRPEDLGAHLNKVEGGREKKEQVERNISQQGGEAHYYGGGGYY